MSFIEQPAVSVCMAVFNGERFLEEQVRSILLQLTANDELIIVDDCSSDRSLSLVAAINDPRIVILKNESNKGPSGSFERAIEAARGQYIFLSDQDDTWSPQKVEITRRIFDATDSLLIVSDARMIDGQRQVIADSLFAMRKSRAGFWRNLYRNGFVGCCMAFRAESREFFMPFPPGVGMHDEWIGLCTSIAGRVCFADDKLIEYRRHGANVTQMLHGSMSSMVRKRLNFLRLIVVRLPRILRWRLARRSMRKD